MRPRLSSIWICAVVVWLLQGAYGQKVKIGYDKGVDFSKFTSYSWSDPTTPPVRPALYQNIVESIDAKLNAKGLTRTSGSGDLVIIPSGGIDFGLNTAAGTPIMPTYSGPPPAMNSTMWTGASGPSNGLAPYVAEGMLMLNFVDRASNKIIWSGTVKDKLDVEPQYRHKALERVEKSIIKLLKDFPPKKK